MGKKYKLKGSIKTVVNRDGPETYKLVTDTGTSSKTMHLNPKFFTMDQYRYIMHAAMDAMEIVEIGFRSGRYNPCVQNMVITRQEDFQIDYIKPLYGKTIH